MRIAPLSSRSSESSRGEKPWPQNNVKNMKVCIRLRSSSEKEWLTLKNEWNKEHGEVIQAKDHYLLEKNYLNLF